jgi:hypothetical protein
LEEVLDKLKDLPLLNKLVDQAHNDICLSDKYSYRAFARTIDRVLSEVVPRKPSWYFGSGNLLRGAGSVVAKMNNVRLNVRRRLKELVR